MQEEAKPYDVGKLPELRRLAEEVQATKRPRRLTREGDSLAMVVPIPASSKRQRSIASGGGEPDNVLLRLLEIGKTAELDPNEPTDVSANKHKYLADAYAPSSSVRTTQR